MHERIFGASELLSDHTCLAVSRTILKRWTKAVGINPLAMALNAERACHLRYGVGTLAGWVFWPSMLMTPVFLICLLSLHYEWAGTLLAVSGISTFIFGVAGVSTWNEGYDEGCNRKAAEKFITIYNQLMRLMQVDSKVAFAQLSESQLEARATEVLVNDLVLLEEIEKEYQDLPRAIGDEKKQPFVATFNADHQFFRLLSLADTKPERYARLAKERIAVKESAGTAQS